MDLRLRLTMLSAAAFGRGDGVAGLVDQEVEYDPATGLPLVRGRTVKGLLVEAGVDLLYGLRRADATAAGPVGEALAGLFGRPGSRLADAGRLRVGPAGLPDDLAAAVRRAVFDGKLTPAEVLEALTDIRRQTAMTDKGAPETGSLRSLRVLLPGVTLTAELTLLEPLGDRDLPVLAACVKGLRRGGTNRNRGLGRFEAELLPCNATAAWGEFRKLVEGAAA